MALTSRIFDFYKLSEADRRKLVGSFFLSEQTPCYVLKLKSAQFNYGFAEGVLGVLPVFQCGYPLRDYFAVRVYSPDDLDLALEFQYEEVGCRDAVLTYLKSMPLQSMTYQEALERIREHVGCGSIG